MRIVKFLGAATVLTMLGGVAASANTLPAQPVHSVTTGQLFFTAQQKDAARLPNFAINMPQRVNVPGTPQVAQQPRKLPLANFGQWDEAASEN